MVPCRYKILLRLRIPSTGLYLFVCIGQAQVVEKFLLNCIPLMSTRTKLPYCELLIYYAFVKSVMTQSLYNCLHRDTYGAYLVGRKDAMNCASRLFHDEALKMDIIRHIKSMGFTHYEQYRKAFAWLKPFSDALDMVMEIAL